jgi:DNA-binding CsgD family transcriptional regulator
VSVEREGGRARELEVLSSLIGDIYDTTLDRSLWPHVLKKIADFVPGYSAAVFWDDAANDSGAVFFEDGEITPAYRDLYFAKYIQLNPTAVPRLFAPAEEPIATADLVPYEEFLKTRFYQEWARPQGLIDFISITLEKSATKSAMFGVFRHERQGSIDDETRRRMRLLGPHLKRAVLISKVVDFKQNEAATFSQTLDSLRVAIFLVAADGHLVHANRAGNGLLAETNVVRAVAGKLELVEPQADQKLHETLIAAANGDRAIGGKGIALPLGQMAPLYVAHVLPLTSGTRQNAGVSSGGTAAVFIHKTAAEAQSSPQLIAAAYALTLTELRVLLAIVEIGGVPAAAEVLGIAATTVRTHLSRIYEKTGINRQADLVKLVAGFSSPLKE